MWGGGKPLSQKEKKYFFSMIQKEKNAQKFMKHKKNSQNKIICYVQCWSKSIISTEKFDEDFFAKYLKI